MKYVSILTATLFVTLGALAIVAGGADDSPGLQLIGVVLIATAITLGYRTTRRPAR